MENAPRLNCLLTAVPEYCVTREETADVIEESFSELVPDRSSLMEMLSHAQIEKRYTHVPPRYKRIVILLRGAMILVLSVQ